MRSCSFNLLSSGSSIYLSGVLTFAPCAKANAAANSRQNTTHALATRRGQNRDMDIPFAGRKLRVAGGRKARLSRNSESMFPVAAGVNENCSFLMCIQHFSNVRQYSVPRGLNV